MRHLLCSRVWLGLAAAPLRAEDPTPAKTLADLTGGTVFVKVAAGPLSSSGSGFLIKGDGETGTLVTNHHVIAPPRPGLIPRITVVFHSGTHKELTVRAVVLASDPARDLAILRVDKVKDLPRPIDLSQRL